MSLLSLLIVFLSCVFVAVVTALIYSFLKKGKGISKDYAEQAVLRRVKNARTIGARFTKQDRGYVWEFDITDGVRVYRVWVDGQNGSLFKAIDLGRKSVELGSSRMMGQRIG